MLIVDSVALPVYCGKQSISIQTVASLWWSAMSVDTRFFGATTVAAVFTRYMFFIVQSTGTSYVIYPMMLNGPLPKLSKSIVVDNVYRYTARPVHCGQHWPLKSTSWAMCSGNDLLYHLYVQGCVTIEYTTYYFINQSTL